MVIPNTHYNILRAQQTTITLCFAGGCPAISHGRIESTKQKGIGEKTMQETIKRVASGALGLLMGGATLMMPVMATADLASFADMKPSDTLIVVGANAITQDVVGAINIGGALAQHGATTTVTSLAGATGAVTGGMSLATSTTPLYMYDPITSARTTIAKGDLSVLDSGAVQDDSGVDYKYDQYITLGTGTITYNKEADMSDPVLSVNMTSLPATPLYTSKVVFNNAINMTDTTKAFGGNAITLFGKEYTIGSTSTNANIILFGSGDAATLADGEETTVTVGGTSYDVKVIGVSGTDIVVASVNGESRSLTKGSSYNIKGLDVYVNDLYFFSKEGSVSSAKLSFGSSRITLTHGEAVKTGTSDTTVEGTLVTIGGSVEVATIEVAVSAADSSTVFLQEGTAFVDPVFGSFKLAFSGVNPSLADSGRDTISVATSGNDRATVTATDYNGVTKSIDFARDSAPATQYTALDFKDVNQYNYNVVEGALVQKSHYLVADAGDFSHLFQVTGLSSLGTASAKATLKDVFSGTSYEITLNTTGQGSKVIDGQVYYANVTASTIPTIELTWGSNAGYVNAGDKTTVFPGIKLKNGEYMYLTAKDQSVTIGDAAKTFKLPSGSAGGTAGDISIVNATGGFFNITATSPAATHVGADTYVNVLVGSQYYNVTRVSGTEAVISLSTGTAQVTQPAVMVIEEKDDNSAYNTVVVQTTDDTDSIKVSSTVLLSGANSGGKSSTSDSSVTRYVDLFGTLITVDTDSDGTITMSYPDTQAIAGVYALETAAEVPAVGVASATGTGTVNQPALNGGLAKVDTEVTSADKTEKNLILVGGPAANALVAELAAANKTHSMDTWMADLVGKYVIQAVEDAFATGKTAIVVAGYDYAQTQAASLKIATEALSGEEVTSA